MHCWTRGSFQTNSCLFTLGTALMETPYPSLVEGAAGCANMNPSLSWLDPHVHIFHGLFWALKSLRCVQIQAVMVHFLSVITVCDVDPFSLDYCLHSASAYSRFVSIIAQSCKASHSPKMCTSTLTCLHIIDCASSPISEFKKNNCRKM